MKESVIRFVLFLIILVLLCQLGFGQKTVSEENKICELCDSAFSAPPISDSIESPIIVLEKDEYDGGKWISPEYFPKYDPFVDYLSKSSAQTLVCINESRVYVASYSDGQPGYRRDWDVRLIKVPTGQVLAAKKFTGDDLPSIKLGTGPVYGGIPKSQLIEWLMTLLGDRTVLATEGNVQSIAFSPNGDILASSDSDGNVKVWDVATGRGIHSIRDSDSMLDVYHMVFSPDGSILALDVDGYKSRIDIFDVANWQKLHSLRWHDNSTGSSIKCLSFSPDGRTLASADSYETDQWRYRVNLWDVLLGRELHILNDYQYSAFLPDGKLLTYNKDAGDTELWDTVNWKKIRQIDEAYASDDSVLSPDGKILATYIWKGEVNLWDIPSGQERTLYLDRECSRDALAFSPDSKVLAIGCDDTIVLMDVVTGQEILTLKGHTAEIECLAFSPDGSILVSGSSDRTIKLWDVVTLM